MRNIVSVFFFGWINQGDHFFRRMKQIGQIPASIVVTILKAIKLQSVSNYNQTQDMCKILVFISK